ncbi:MAG: hypothetical protein A2X48_16915 [Lentisphaerae bacterium GWF2_49_21]|nr:MAG: hypothetical protein A2X48_16915 [Lentisphaerae bacterium GWF2_49_21]
MLKTVSILLISIFFSSIVLGNVKLPAIISGNMVLQADTKVKIWGKAEAGENVTVLFAGQEKKTSADKDGRWMVELDPMKADAESKVLTVQGKNKIEVKNVLVGEVWIGSGQSNMELTVANSANPDAEAKEANYPLIRHFTVTKDISGKPKDDLEGKWVICSPGTVKGFSAVLYFFGRDLHSKSKFPVGLIHSSWGGSTIQPWLPKEVMAANPDFPNDFKVPEDKYADLKTYAEFKKDEIKKISKTDAGNQGEKEGWEKLADFKDGWKETVLPQPLEKAAGAEMDGAVWFARNVEIPEKMAGKDLVIELGATYDAMTAYFNGEKIGSREFTIDYGKTKFTVPAKTVKIGKNTLVLRFFNPYGPGGLLSKNGDELILTGNGGKSGLGGKWYCRVEQKYEPGELPMKIPHPRKIPSALHNAMIAPLDSFAVRGVLWYQGESNAGDQTYGKMLSSLISSWREKKGLKEMSFMIVQLPNHGSRPAEPSDSPWAVVREGQRSVLVLPNTAMITTLDIGEAHNIHPLNKQDIGKRLALAARNICYGEKDLEYSGPLFSSMEIKDGKALIKFTHIKGGLAVKGGAKLKGFAIAGADGKYFWADAEIKGDAVAVWSEKVKDPLSVRYAWADDPDCNLLNGEGFPASTFQSGK